MSADERSPGPAPDDPGAGYNENEEQDAYERAQPDTQPEVDSQPEPDEEPSDAG